MDRLDGVTLFFIGLVVAIVAATVIWGPTPAVIAALIGVPVTLGAIVGLSLTAKA
jgi:hypothetical protein